MQQVADNSRSYKMRSAELSPQQNAQYSICMYDNRLEPRHREKIPHAHLAIEIDIFGDYCRGTYVIGDKSYDIYPGDIFILRSNEEHSIIDLKKDKRGESICTGIQFPPDFLWSPNSEFGDISYLYNVFLNTMPGFNHKLDCGKKSTECIRQELKTIIEEFDRSNIEYRLMVKVKLIAVLIMLAREYCSQGWNPQIRSIQKEKRILVLNTMEYINAHLYKELTLKELAAHVHISPSYLSEIFKRLNGFSIWEYILAERCERAKQYLLESNDLVVNIGLKCGFNSLTNFNRVFKKYTGFTPRNYRKEVHRGYWE